MRLKVLGLCAAIALLGACETTPLETGAAAGVGETGAATGAGGAVAAVEAGGGLGTAGAMMLAPNVPDRVYFDFDEYTLKPEARRTLQMQAEWLKTNRRVAITIEGHADERGTREYNLALGERRANAVRNYLIALGVDPGNILTVSYGKERPAVPGSVEAAWAMNRRGVTVVK